MARGAHIRQAHERTHMRRFCNAVVSSGVSFRWEASPTTMGLAVFTLLELIPVKFRFYSNSAAARVDEIFRNEGGLKSLIVMRLRLGSHCLITFFPTNILLDSER